MKHYIILGIFAVSGIVFFGSRSYGAETVLDTNYNLIDTMCVAQSQYGPSEIKACSVSTEWGAAYQETYAIGQEYPIIPIPGAITISAFSFYYQTNDTGMANDVYATGYLLNEEQWFANKGTNNIPADAVATTSPVTLRKVGPNPTEAKFTLITPYQITENTPTDGAVAALYVVYSVGAGTVPGAKWKISNGGNLQSDFYPYLWDGCYRGLCPLNTASDYDLFTTIYRNDTPLAINDPNQGEMVDNLFSIDGSCPETVHGVLYKGFPLASSTEALYYPSIACNAGSWQLLSGGLSSGSWYFDATTTYASASVGFYYIGSDINENFGTIFDDFTNCVGNYVSWSCDLPLVGDFCAAGALVANSAMCTVIVPIQYTTNYIRTTKPMSYAFDLYDAAKEGLQTTSTTSTLDLSIPVFGQTREIFNASSTPAQAIPIGTWETLRPYTEWAVYIGFIIYLITLLL